MKDISNLKIEQSTSGITMIFPFILARPIHAEENVREPFWLEYSRNDSPTEVEIKATPIISKHQRLDDWQSLPRLPISNGSTFYFQAFAKRIESGEIAVMRLPLGGCLWTMLPQ